MVLSDEKQRHIATGLQASIKEIDRLFNGEAKLEVSTKHDEKEL